MGGAGEGGTVEEDGQGDDSGTNLKGGLGTDSVGRGVETVTGVGDLVGLGSGHGPGDFFHF